MKETCPETSKTRTTAKPDAPFSWATTAAYLAYGRPATASAAHSVTRIVRRG